LDLSFEDLTPVLIPTRAHLATPSSMADLRSNSVDSNRVITSKAKWARGEAYGAGRAKDGHAAPAKVKPKFPRTNEELRVNRNHKDAQRHEIRSEVGNNSDSSDMDEPMEPCAAPDADITYSFDANRGPTHGSTILSHALNKAVERFENTATERLVKDEYDVLPTNPEEVLRTPIKKGGKGTALTAEEDDYEFV